MENFVVYILLTPRQPILGFEIPAIFFSFFLLLTSKSHNLFFYFSTDVAVWGLFLVAQVVFFKGAILGYIVFID